MSSTLDLSVLPSRAYNHPDAVEIYRERSFWVGKVTSTNDADQVRTRLIMARISEGDVPIPVNVVLILARFQLHGQNETYIVLTRQWREATAAYSIAFPAGKFDKDDVDVVAAGLRELAEETPFTADRDDVFFESVISFSSDGCLGETNQMLGVQVQAKPGTLLQDGLAQGATNQTKTEHIQTLFCEESKLYPTLLEWQRQKHSIDSRLLYYASGLYLTPRATAAA